MLLVDDDQAEPAHRREDRRAGADDHARLAARDPLALVAPLGVGEPEWRIATRSPNRARTRPTVCGASEISGTSRIAPSPRSSTAAQTWR